MTHLAFALVLGHPQVQPHRMCYYVQVLLSSCVAFVSHSLLREVQLTRTKLEGNQASRSPTAPHHQSCSWTSRTWITSPALKASSCSSIVTWSHRASAYMPCPDCMYWRKREIIVRLNVLRLKVRHDKNSTEWQHAHEVWRSHTSTYANTRTTPHKHMIEQIR